MLFEKNIATVAGLEDTNIINNWIVIAAALLLTVGFAILLPSKKKKRKLKEKKGHGLEFNINGAENNFGASSVYVDCTDFTPSRIENNLGSCTVQFQNVENYVGGKTLHIENNIGSIVIQVPSAWVVKTSIENSIGSLEVPDEEDKAGPLVYINGENNLGRINITFV
jgi:predicted membrane protein